MRDAREAVIRGAEKRLVPILMTALAAGLALVPLALTAGQPGSEIQSPMAVVILFGLACPIVCFQAPTSLNSLLRYYTSILFQRKVQGTRCPPYG